MRAARCSRGEGEPAASDLSFVAQRLDRLDGQPAAHRHIGSAEANGDHDECDPSLSKEMHEKIGGSQLVILANSGHMNFVDQPDLWQKSVQDFLGAK